MLSPAKRTAVFWGLGISAVVLTLCLGWLGYRQYLLSRQPRLIAESREAFQREDYKEASLAVRRALRVDPDNIEANRLMAEFADAFSLQEGLAWRRRVFELEPEAYENLADYVRVAIIFQAWDEAKQAMETARPGFGNKAEYHALSAALAFSLGDRGLALVEFQRALDLDPDNQELRLNLAVLRLSYGSEGDRASALNELEKFSSRPLFEGTALKALLHYARRTGDLEEAGRLARRLSEVPGASFDDKLIVLDTYYRLGWPQADEVLKTLKKESQSDLLSLHALISWLNVNGKAALVVDWLDDMDNDMVTEAPLAISVAESYELLKDWEKLGEWSAKVRWNDFNYIGQLIEAYVQKQTNPAMSEEAYRRSLNHVIRTAESDQGKLINMAQMARAWQWERAWVEILWAIADEDTTRDGALKQLYSYYNEKKNTRGLYRVMLNAYTAKPDDVIIRNNLASLRLLLGQDRGRGHEMAEENYRLNPLDTALASTYALSCYYNGELEAGLEALEKLSKDELREDPTALYYAVLLAANDRTELAREIAGNLDAGSYLPEEWELLGKIL